MAKNQRKRQSPTKSAESQRDAQLQRSRKAPQRSRQRNKKSAFKRVYAEPGSVIAVPLRSGGWAHALVSHVSTARRRGSRRVMLNIIDGIREKAGDLASTDPAHWKYVYQLAVHEVFIVDGTWPLVLHLKDFDRSAWRLPRGVEMYLVDGKWHEVVYHEDTLLTTMNPKAVSDERARSYPTVESNWGAGIVPDYAEWAIKQRWPGFKPHEHPVYVKLRSYTHK